MIQLLFVLVTLPLIIYPLVFMASIMGLSAPVQPGSPIFPLIVARIFLISSLLYPVGWIIGRLLPTPFGVFFTVTHLIVCLLSFLICYALSL